MSRSASEIKECTLLGNTGVKYPVEYDPSLLEAFVNKHPDNEYAEEDMNKKKKCLNQMEHLADKEYPDRNGILN